ncbi:MAG: hypothetical protein ACTHME_05140 [Candidatus Nitrosocosmicus sp.]
MINSDNYYKSIIELADYMNLNGQMPNIHNKSFKDAVIASFLKEKEYSQRSKTYGYLQFICFVDLFREKGEIFDLISDYINKDEEDEERQKIAIKIADSIVKSASLYYWEDIETDTHTLYSRKFYGNY